MISWILILGVSTLCSELGELEVKKKIWGANESFTERKSMARTVTSIFYPNAYIYFAIKKKN